MDDLERLHAMDTEVVTDDLANLATDPLPLPEGSPPPGPSDSVEPTVEAGSKPLIGKDAYLKFPNALASTGGILVLSSVGWGKDASALHPFLTTCVSLDVSKEFVLLKIVERIETEGSDLTAVVLRGHKWFPKALFHIARDKREARLHWLEQTFKAGGNASDSEEPKHDFWYHNYCHNLQKNHELVLKGEVKNINFRGFKQSVEGIVNAIPLMLDRNDPTELGSLIRTEWSKLTSVQVNDKSSKRKRTGKSHSSLSKRFKSLNLSTTAETSKASAKESPKAVIDVEGETSDEVPAAQSNEVLPLVPKPVVPSTSGGKIPSPQTPLYTTPPPVRGRGIQPLGFYNYPPPNFNFRGNRGGRGQKYRGGNNPNFRGQSKSTRASYRGGSNTTWYPVRPATPQQVSGQSTGGSSVASQPYKQCKVCLLWSGLFAPTCSHCNAPWS